MKKVLAIALGAVVFMACLGLIVTKAAADTSKSKVTSLYHQDGSSTSP
jgi:hypothetical protein